MSIIFNFTLRSVVLYFVIVFVNQITNKHKLMPLVFKIFKYCRQYQSSKVLALLFILPFINSLSAYLHCRLYNYRSKSSQPLLQRCSHLRSAFQE